MQKVIIFDERLDSDIENTLNKMLTDGWMIVNMVSQPISVCGSDYFQWKYGSVMVVLEKRSNDS